jgi:hypothetical protein
VLITEFRLQPRGPCLFDTWRWNHLIGSAIGNLPLELHTAMGAQPSVAMVQLATELGEFVSSSGEHLLDLIYGHYLYAQAEGWLSFWGVPSSVSRAEVLSFVDVLSLVVDEELNASVHVDPRWDPEHKLALTYKHGAITEANDAPYHLENGVLSPDA